MEEGWSSILVFLSMAIMLYHTSIVLNLRTFGEILLLRTAQSISAKYEYEYAQCTYPEDLFELFTVSETKLRRR